MKALHGVLILAAVALAAPTLLAQDDAGYTKKTELTFSAPVRLPGMDLGAGKYQLELADPVNDRKVIRVSSADGKKVYGLLLTTTSQSIEKPRGNDPVVLFSEMPAGTPPAVRAWFYAGESIGYEFVYPKSEAMEIAAATHQRVRAMDNDKKDRSSLNGAKVGWVDPNGSFTDNGSTATSGTTSPAPTDKK